MQSPDRLDKALQRYFATLKMFSEARPEQKSWRMHVVKKLKMAFRDVERAANALIVLQGKSIGR